MQGQKRSSTDSHSRKGIEEAVEYVSKAWFPVNTSIVKMVQAKLKQGVYNHNRTALLTDLKSDQALFTNFLSKLGEVVEHGSADKNPALLLRTLEIERLASVLDGISASGVSTHRFEGSSKIQTLRIRHSLISSTTAETLAQKMDVDNTLSFLCASVRQLGLNLIAWNYPRIYAKALASLNVNNNDLDTALLTVLGYSPLSLGAQVALGWNKNLEIREAMGVVAVAVPGKDNLEATRIRGFCEVGEALARVNDAEHFPGATSEAAGVMQAVSHVLGPQGMSILKSRLESSAHSYQEISPNLFKFDISLEKNLKVAHSQYAGKLLEENLYLSKCSIDVLEQFRKVYETLEAGRVSTAALNILVGEVLPYLGFTQGCLYLVDAKGLNVVPMLRIGEAPLERYRTLPCSETSNSPHPVVAALSYTAPIVQENVFLNGDQVSHVTGTFGNRDKTGVLYLEMSPELCEGDRQTPLLYFKAIRGCLNDCLNIH